MDRDSGSSVDAARSAHEFVACNCAWSWSMSRFCSVTALSNFSSFDRVPPSPPHPTAKVARIMTLNITTQNDLWIGFLFMLVVRPCFSEVTWRVR